MIIFFRCGVNNNLVELNLCCLGDTLTILLLFGLLILISLMISLYICVIIILKLCARNYDQCNNLTIHYLIAILLYDYRVDLNQFIRRILFELFNDEWNVNINQVQ